MSSTTTAAAAKAALEGARCAKQLKQVYKDFHPTKKELKAQRVFFEESCVPSGQNRDSWESPKLVGMLCGF